MKRTSLILLMGLALAQCRPFEPDFNGGTPDDETNVAEKTMAELVVPDGFNFENITDRSLQVSAVDNSGNLMPGINFRAVLRAADTPDDTLFFGRTDENGLYETKLALGATDKKLVIETNFPGLPPVEVDLANAGASIQVKLGEHNQAGFREGEHSFEKADGGITHGEANMADDRATYGYIGTYTSQGVPNYLTAERERVSQDILNLIANNLPEGQPVPTYHPQYIANGVVSSLPLTDSAEVWITFVHEGAGYMNALGYYTYPTGSTPANAAALGTLKVIFPNLSFTGSGGGMTTGDKVYLGIFPPNTTIGWFLTPDGWTSNTQKVTDKSNKPVRYSDKQYNTFASTNYRNHVAELVDPNRELILLGFEDLNRPSGDNDFNDAIFYVSATPFSSVNRSGMVETTIVGADTDDDGVADPDDACPTDPNCAFFNYYPVLNTFGSLAFEDMFPLEGDYDLNDIVVDYNFKEILNTAQKVTSMEIKVKLRAMGGSFRNGFAVHLPVAASKVASVTGYKRTDSYVTLAATGVEANQSEAVILCFDNGYDLLRTSDGGFVNTDPSRPILDPYVLTINVNFTEPIPRSDIGYAPYNPFIFIHRDRTKEVHLPGKMPTELANLSLFQTGDDDTNLATGKTYMTHDNLPWAINFPRSIPYLREKTPINQGFLKFNEWAQSGGAQFSDWYDDKPGYRNIEKIF